MQSRARDVAIAAGKWSGALPAPPPTAGDSLDCREQAAEGQRPRLGSVGLGRSLLACSGSPSAPILHEQHDGGHRAPAGGRARDDEREPIAFSY